MTVIGDAFVRHKRVLTKSTRSGCLFSRAFLVGLAPLTLLGPGSRHCYGIITLTTGQRPASEVPSGDKIGPDGVPVFAGRFHLASSQVPLTRLPLTRL
jgi:hypothetical protein